MTIRPRPRSSIPGITARQHRWTPRTFTSKVRHHSPGSVSQERESREPVPALAKSSSTGPVSATARSTASREVTSSSTARPPISDATASTWSRERAPTTTSKPSAASARAAFAPIPRPPPVTSATRSGNRGLDRVQRLRVLERRDVARVGAERLRAHGTADDLRRARLRQRVDEHDPVRLERLPELVRDRGRDLGGERRRRLVPRQEAAEDPRDLALHLVRHADRRGLSDRGVADRGRLELRRPHPLAGDVERVVGAAVEEPESVLVDRRPVAVRPDPGEAAPVGLDELLRIAPEAACHARERPAADELADLAGADERAPVAVDHVHRHSERGAADRAGLDRRNGRRRQEAGADLGPARAVDDRDARVTDRLEEPPV